MSRIVMTVLGPVAADLLGTTITHEHCFVDATVWFVEPEEGSRRGRSDHQVTMEMLAALRRRPFSTTKANLVLSDEDACVQELNLFANYGGRTVVDVTPVGMGRDALGLQRVARRTGLNIVMATGIYVENAHPEFVWGMDADQVASFFVSEIVEGVADTGVRCGLIGEIGLSGIERGRGRIKTGAITAEEEKVLRGAARAARSTGCAVSLHLDPIQPRAGLLALDILDEEHLAPNRIIVGHMDQVRDFDYHLEVAKRGAFIEYDSLGRDHYAEEWGYDFDWGHDSWRTRFAARLIAEGYGKQLLFSQDVCLKTDLTRYGGPGYAHALKHIVPTLRSLGVDGAAIDDILIHNPARALSLEAVR